MTTIALLRGINVGGARKLPMADLRAFCGDLGFLDVRTFIASGNLLWSGTQPGSPAARDAVAALHEGIRDRWGYEVPVVTRQAAELVAVRDGNPFPDAPQEKWLHVAFLDRAPEQAAVDALDPNRGPGDRFAVRGRHIYLCYGNGSGNSKLTGDWFERQLGVTATARNWRTLKALIELSGA